MTQKIDKRKVVKQLAEKLGEAYVAELMAEKKYQEAKLATHGARTPTPGDHANVVATKKNFLAKSRARMQVLAELDEVVGIKREHKTPPGKIIDNSQDD